MDGRELHTPGIAALDTIVLTKTGVQIVCGPFHKDGRKMSQQMRQVGNSLDRIGWRHVTEGKVSIALREMQADYLRRTRTQVKIDRWMKGFIDKLLTLSHTQWLCRNLTKHHKTKGAKALLLKQTYEER